MDSDQGKLLIGGISWETSEDKLKDYFSNYGDILQAVIMRDKITGRPRGFGFVVFADPSVLDSVLQERHTIDGRTVEAKRALSREEQQVSKAANPSGGRGGEGGGNMRTKKIFVGGLPATLSEETFRDYFAGYGQVTDVVVMYDQQTNRPRGFGFISFDSEEAVDRVLHKTFHDLNGKQVEVKRALPKDANPGGGGGRSMGGGGYQGFGGAGGDSGSYEGRMDSGRYMQNKSYGGGFPAYGSGGYGTPGYGYGPGSNGMGYNGYGGYGGGNPGFGGQAGAPYGNLNAPSAAYGSGPFGPAQSSWNAQPNSGYGGAGAYGNAPWGGSVAGGAGGPQAAAPTGQSPSGAAGYGNQAYGYGGGYGSGDGSYGNPAGYGAVGGRIGSGPNSNAGAGADFQSGGGGNYVGSGYGGDANGNSGYGNSGWRGDQGNGGQAGYGGYGSAPARQG
ncbi:heterogeneous nuclear ribonucleoprotein 1-like [Bidens hawaiensis]|uniref:heterogeneous nuclear ribonucleoprotein 1-like n=1 Tax=Bidens hawaiensis TaxID=980011 RepID=UPI0040497E3E